MKNELPEELIRFDHQPLGEALYFPHITNNEYHDSPGVSSSVIRNFMDSQLHALEEEVLQTSALKFGSAAHSLIVEGESAFNNDVACIVGSPYTQYNKDLKADYESRGLTVITQKEKDTIFAMKENLLGEAKILLHPADFEFPEIFTYPYERALYWWEDDILLKVKADVVRCPTEPGFDKDTIIIVDYKTTQSCEPNAFASSIKKYKYDLQAAWYKRGFEKAGFKVAGFYFVAQEKKYPYACKIFKMKASDMEEKWQVLEQYLGEYKEVLNGKQPSVYNTPDIVEVDLKGEESDEKT